MPRKSVPKLVVSRRQALRDLNAQMNAGQDLLNRRAATLAGLQKLKAEIDDWTTDNVRILTTSLNSDAYVLEYTESMSNLRLSKTRDPLEELDRLRFALTDELIALESLMKRVELLEEDASPAPSGKSKRGTSNRVFLVHGHDQAALHMVQSFLFRLQLEPVILAAEANAGKTIIEKFESQSSNVSYAIVLLTPDDRGAAAASASDPQPRARQNVIFELGYFVGKLGRDKVCPLYKNGVEIPSDYHGVGYVLMDEHEGWMHRVAKEMIAAGLKIDRNLI